MSRERVFPRVAGEGTLGRVCTDSPRCLASYSRFLGITHVPRFASQLRDQTTRDERGKRLSPERGQNFTANLEPVFERGEKARDNHRREEIGIAGLPRDVEYLSGLEQLGIIPQVGMNLERLIAIVQAVDQDGSRPRPPRSPA